MEKAGLKTFVYSFVFSLFALFSANSVYLRSKTTSHDVKISNKNITLFLKNMPQSTPQAYAAPTKKIVLSVIADTSSPQKKEVRPAIPLDSGDIAEERIVSTETDAIPLEGSFTPKEKDATEPRLLLADASYDFPQKVSEDSAKIDNTSPPDISPEAEGQDGIDENDTAFEPFANMTDELPSDNNFSPDNEDVIEVAEATDMLSQPASEPKEDDIPPQLIPLEKENGIIRTANKTIEVINAPSGNQVALKSNNVPIKSMTETKTKAAEKTPAQKEWQQMSEKKKGDTDNAWLVAKSRNPQNGLLAKHESFQKTYQEIEQLLSAKTIESGTPIEIAAETPKNLLIPIPEEILKDENLTPQLTSSPENKAIEEKLHRESGDDRFRDDYIDTPKEEKSGLLDSLTSIFSKKDQNTPEIGDAVEDDSKGLFSAFRKKRSRPKNGAKILPTEMRLSFQPNRAEISGQTLRWIRAFANKTRQEKTVGLEIRIDGTSSPLLQQRRLNLLQNILLKEDVDGGKVKTVFTAREPNSFIIRTIRVIPRTENPPPRPKQRNNEQYLQW